MGGPGFSASVCRQPPLNCRRRKAGPNVEKTLARPRVADDFAAIRARMDELRREREGSSEPDQRRQAAPMPDAPRRRGYRWTCYVYADASERTHAPRPRRVPSWALAMVAYLEVTWAQ
jgi:hypothetical protein